MLKPSCGANNSMQILMMLQEEVEKRELFNEIKVTGCSCLGPCENGPMIVVYPEGIWYAGVKPEHVNQIVEQHMIAGKPVEELIYTWPES